MQRQIYLYNSYMSLCIGVPSCGHNRTLNCFFPPFKIMTFGHPQTETNYFQDFCNSDGNLTKIKVCHPTFIVCRNPNSETRKVKRLTMCLESSGFLCFKNWSNTFTWCCTLIKKKRKSQMVQQITDTQGHTGTPKKPNKPQQQKVCNDRFMITQLSDKTEFFFSYPYFTSVISTHKPHSGYIFSL